MCRWDKLWTTRYKKTKNPTATSEEAGAKAGYCACPLLSTPPKGWADHLSHRSCPTPGHTPTLTPCKELAHPTSGSEWPREPVTYSRSPTAAAGTPVKPCLNFLSGLWSISIDWGRPRTLVGKKGTKILMVAIQFYNLIYQSGCSCAYLPILSSFLLLKVWSAHRSPGVPWEHVRGAESWVPPRLTESEYAF